MASLFKEEMGDLRQDLLKEKEKCKNWEGQGFIHYEAACAIVTQSRILAWSRQHPLCRKHQTACPKMPYFISRITNDKVLVFVVLVLSQLEYLFEELEAGVADHRMLFDIEAFNKICESTGLSERERRSFYVSQLEVGWVFSDGDVQYLPRNALLPFFNRDNVGMRGASGQIFRVKMPGQHLPSHSNGAVTIAEKHIRPDSGSSKSEWERLLREVRTLRQRQNHANIIALLAAYQQEVDESGLPVKTLHLLFPWAEGDLKEWINQRQTPSNVKNLSRKERQNFLYRCIYGLVSGVSYLHSEIEGTLATHHDLKPGNILWVGGELKIADFGHSHLRPVIEGSRTEGVSEVGTYEYHPPEFWNPNGSRSEVKPGRDLDVWAMGCIIVELLVLVIHDWETCEMARFAMERHDSRASDRKRTDKYLADDDSSFHNSLAIVDAWTEALYKRRSSDHPQRLEKVHDVAIRMLDANPEDRPYMWESQMDLHEVLCQHDNRIPVLEKDLCVPPQASRPKKGGISDSSGVMDTPLHRAIRNGDFKRTVRLWELGWPLSSRNGEDERPLRMLAASKDSQLRGLPDDVAKMLKAASDGQIDQLKQLFGRGLSPLMIDKDGQSALHQTISSFQPLDSNSDRLTRDGISQRNMQLLRTVELLLETKGKDLVDLRAKGEFPLQTAARKGFLEALRRILHESPDINGRAEKNHLSPLYLAASECHPRAVELLLEHKAKVRLYSDANGRNPLHGVLSSREKKNEDQVCEILELLLKADDGKECIDDAEVIQGPPLIRAANLGYLKCCLLLTRYGASVHTSDINKRGLLHEIASNGWADFLQQVLGEFTLEELEARALNVNPREIAKKNGHKQIVHLLDSRRHEMKGLESNATSLWGCLKSFKKN